MSWEIRQGDALTLLREMPAETVQTVVTSPPYWGLRDYGNEGQLGLEPTSEQYVQNLVEVFCEVRRVLRDDGCVWLNLGDSYASGGDGYTGRNDTERETPGGRGGSFRGGARQFIERSHGLKPKDLCGIPWRVAFALQADGWWLRSDIVWSKPNPMPESVRDRPTRSHEYLFLLTKSARYFFDAAAVAESSVSDHDSGTVEGNPTRNIRSVWNITTQPFPHAHFATFPEKLVEPCVLAGSSPKACGECGYPWERIVERMAVSSDVGETEGRYSHDEGILSRPARGIGKSRQFYREQGLEGPPPSQTVGWYSPCPHADDSGSCLVLDPFAGSGTVGVVALRHNRSFIGLELNPSYVEMARNRIRDDAPLLNAHLEREAA